MPRKKSNTPPFYTKIKLSTYVIGFLVLIMLYFTYRYRHGINYYFSIIEKTLKGEKITDDKVTKYDIRNIEVMDNYYLKTFGVDVSHYQGEIDWTKMHTIYQLYPIKFAFIRSTMGGSALDETFEENWKGAKENNILRGAYHFYRPDENSTLQAQNFIRKVKIENGDLPPVLDIETMPRTQSVDKMIEGLKNWCKIVEEHYDIKPIIYTSDKYYEDFLQAHFEGYIIWIANYNFWVERMKGHWDFWQFTEKATIDGVKSNKVDVNIYNGTVDDLEALTL
ncbi:glycoside hydrolase family 25 protein [Algoriella sp.]|uniref:glycoside hydrolase family 25 protein n=1 Tax=Algoriella sp. TaxID=1872434 RepID=UPI001B23BC50|nr:GH25 family lysozyme [Algoriella sp.]MBO6213538.1 glycoside hydrolase family 25 protein [Algoriella sp.]